MTSYAYPEGVGIVVVRRLPGGDVAQFLRAAGGPALAEERPATATEAAELDRIANRSDIQQQAGAALQANRDFLALQAPTNAQVLAQVRALTRQNNGLIRLALRRFDGSD